MPKVDRRLLKSLSKPQNAPPTKGDAYLKEIEAEMQALSGDSPDTIAPGNAFVANLAMWQATETERVVSHERYKLFQGLGREAQQFVQAYGEAKKALMLIEDELVDLARQMEPKTLDMLMAPGRSFGLPGLEAVSLPTRLAERIKARLNGAEESEDGEKAT